MHKSIAVGALALFLATPLFSASAPDASDPGFPRVARDQRRRTIKRVTPRISVDCAYDENGDPIPCNDDWGNEPFTGADQTKYNNLCTPSSEGTRYTDMTCRTPTTGVASQYCADMQGRVCDIFQRENGIGACKTCTQ